MVADKVCPQTFEGQVDVREVQQAGCVESRVVSVRWKAERQAACYQAVKVSMQCSVRGVSP